MKAGGFLQPEHQVHVLYGLPGSSLQKIIADTADQYLSVFFLQVEEAFVGMYNLLEIQRLIADMRKRSVCIICLI